MTEKKKIEYLSGFNEVYELGDILGSGNFADVVEGSLVTHKLEQSNYAVKIVYKDNLETTEDEEALEREIQILSDLNHSHIVKLYSVYNESDAYYLVTEYLGGGELFLRLESKEYYTEKEARDIAKILFSAITYCHEEHHIAHRDLKPENLVLVSQENDYDIKIIDFGFAKYAPSPQSLQTQCGTIEYAAPEILAKKKYGVGVDMWSLGVILYTLLCGYEPFSIGTSVKRMSNIVHGKYVFHEEYWDEISQDAKDLVRGLMQVRPNLRLTGKQALENSWVLTEDEVLRKFDRTESLEMLKKFNAKRKLKAAVRVVMFSQEFTKIMTHEEEPES